MKRGSMTCKIPPKMRRKTGRNINCKFCNKSFYIEAGRFGIKKYCSFDCANKDLWGFKPRQKKCLICNECFDIKHPLRNADKYCGDECRKTAFSALAQKRFQRLKNSVLVRKCKYCGSDFDTNLYCPRNFCGGKVGACYKKYLSESRKGTKNPAYRNGKAMEGSRTYTGKHLRACSKYRQSFLEKNSYLFCEVCGINAMGTMKFEVHHIYYASLYPKHVNLHDFRNLILVCIQCHNNFHSGKMRSDIFLNLEKERGLKELFAK